MTVFTHQTVKQHKNTHPHEKQEGNSTDVSTFNVTDVTPDPTGSSCPLVYCLSLQTSH